MIAEGPRRSSGVDRLAASARRSSLKGQLLLAAGAFALGLLAGGQFVSAAAPPRQQGPIKTVYHFTDGLAEASRGLANIRNHLAADPSARIMVVANGNGIEFLLDGARDKNGNPYEVIVQDLRSRNVDFRICNNTLVSRNIERSRVIEEAVVVPSGVAEAARLQAREGYAYLKP
jgi:intracellular sulfur oxidation DsrE/DsrF family protein